MKINIELLTIIETQQALIKDLLLLLKQHISAEEYEALEEKYKNLKQP